MLSHRLLASTPMRASTSFLAMVVRESGFCWEPGFTLGSGSLRELELH